MTSESILTASKARLMYADKTYFEALDKVNKRIKLAALTTDECIVDVPVKHGYRIKRTLVDYGGFDVKLVHDPENGSSELTINWENAS